MDEKNDDPDDKYDNERPGIRIAPSARHAENRCTSPIHFNETMNPQNPSTPSTTMTL